MRIKELQDKLKKLRPLNKAELQRITENFIIDNTYNSNAIEGNTITLRETALILQQGITIAKKPLKEHLDIIGYKDAFYYILELADKNEKLTDTIIKDIHTLVLMDDRENKGKYRKINVSIIGALHQTAKPFEIESNLIYLINEYHKKLQQDDIIKTICWFHLEFEKIHPFIDGNGRTGRLILNLELIKNGLLPINIKYTDKEEYYTAFDEYHKGNINYFVDMVTRYEIEELEKYINMISE